MLYTSRVIRHKNKGTTQTHYKLFVVVGILCTIADFVRNMYIIENETYVRNRTV